MLTPRDIHQAEFKRVWKGYSTEEVDDFLRRVVLEYEAVYKENKSLKEEAEGLRAKLEEYSRTERNISETLEMAREAASATKSAAEREANAIVKDAQAEAEEVTRRAADRIAEERRRLETYVQDVLRFRHRLQESMQQLAAHLDDFDEPIVKELIESADVEREAAVGDDEDDELGGAQP